MSNEVINYLGNKLFRTVFELETVLDVFIHGDDSEFKINTIEKPAQVISYMNQYITDYDLLKYHLMVNDLVSDTEPRTLNSKISELIGEHFNQMYDEINIAFESESFNNFLMGKEHRGNVDFQELRKRVRKFIKNRNCYAD